MVRDQDRRGTDGQTLANMIHTHGSCFYGAPSTDRDDFNLVTGKTEANVSELELRFRIFSLIGLKT